MFSSAVVRPSAASPAKNDSDQAVPLLSKSSWVDHIGVVGDEAARAAGVLIAKPPSMAASTVSAVSIVAAANGSRRRTLLPPLDGHLARRYAPSG
jgi:hypothetical protein